MALLITSSILLGVYLALLMAGAIARHRQQYDRFVNLEIAALIAVAINAAGIVIWGTEVLPVALSAVTVTVQALGVRQARRYRREWQGWRDLHTLHTCNEDCPGWLAARS